jgi:Hemerythrin HHE cation binding domain
VDYKLDMSSMLAIHLALRRDLERLGRIAARPDGNPARLLQATVGWEQFKMFLVAHHTAEDLALWPALRRAVAANADQVALADALEEEHSVIGPLLAAIDAAGADLDDGHQRFGDIVDELIVKLSAHLSHEESDGFALIDAALTPEQWQHFAAVNADLVRPEAANYMPWLLSEADQETLDATLGKFPPQLLTAYREQWAPAYADRDVWKGL